MAHECYECRWLSPYNRKNAPHTTSTGKCYCNQNREYVNAETHGACCSFERAMDRSYREEMEIKHYCHNIFHDDDRY